MWSQRDQRPNYQELAGEEIFCAKSEVLGGGVGVSLSREAGLDVVCNNCFFILGSHKSMGQKEGLQPPASVTAVLTGAGGSRK